MRRVLAEVLEVKGDEAKVRVLSSNCASCPHKRSCLSSSMAQRELTVENKGYHVGQIIEVEEELSEFELLKGFAILFGVPLSMILLGAGIGSVWGQPLIGGVLGLGVSFLLLRLIDKSVKL